MPDFAWDIWMFAAAVTVVAGIVKGVVGFAMPMIMISGLAVFMPPDLALATLILPTLTMNLWQAGRGGIGAAVDAAWVHWRFLVVLWICIAISAQLVYVLPESVLVLALGIPVTLFAVVQFFGWRLRFPPSARRRVELSIAAVAGLIGGLSGVWGPPTVAYLTALDTEKREQIRVQGVVYGTGALMLVGSHIKSGVLTAETAQLSAAMLAPAFVGMGIGLYIQDRIDQALFRKLTLVVLIVAGLNLIRRGLIG